MGAIHVQSVRLAIRGQICSSLNSLSRASLRCHTSPALHCCPSGLLSKRASLSSLPFDPPAHVNAWMHEITFGDIFKTTRLSKQNDIRRCKFAKKPKSACPVKKAQSSIFINWSCRTCIPVSNHSTAHAPARRVEPCTASLVKDRGKSRALKPC